MDLVNAGVVVADADADVERERLSDAAGALLADDGDRAAVIGADLSRLPEERFATLFDTALERLRTAAERLPAGNRSYVVGVATDGELHGSPVDLGGDEAPGYLTGADLAFAYAPRDDGDGAAFAHLTESLERFDYLLPALSAGGRLDGSETTMDAFRRELVARHARRLTLLGSDRERYDEEFRFVLAAPLSAYDRIAGEGIKS
jgi:hypothetical protein